MPTIRPRILKVHYDDCGDVCQRVVAVPTIRPRILKAQNGGGTSTAAIVAVPTIRPRILKDTFVILHLPTRNVCCSAHDPTEDTEGPQRAGGRSATSVAVPTIRPRILKGTRDKPELYPQFRCSAHDPTEDTESDGPQPAPGPAGAVAVPTIRPRILKVARIAALVDIERDSCSAHDPTEDTERFLPG